MWRVERGEVEPASLLSSPVLCSHWSPTRSHQSRSVSTLLPSQPYVLGAYGAPGVSVLGTGTVSGYMPVLPLHHYSPYDNLGAINRGVAVTVDRQSVQPARTDAHLSKASWSFWQYWLSAFRGCQYDHVPFTDKEKKTVRS